MDTRVGDARAVDARAGESEKVNTGANVIFTSWSSMSGSEWDLAEEKAEEGFHSKNGVCINEVLKGSLERGWHDEVGFVTTGVMTKYSKTRFT